MGYDRYDHLALGPPAWALGSDHGPIVLRIPVAVAAKDRVLKQAYSHSRGHLNDIRPDCPGMSKVAAEALERTCGNLLLREAFKDRTWLSSAPGCNLRCAI